MKTILAKSGVPGIPEMQRLDGAALDQWAFWADRVAHQTLSIYNGVDEMRTVSIVSVVAVLAAMSGQVMAREKPVRPGYVPVPSTSAPAGGTCAAPEGTISYAGNAGQTVTGSTTGGTNNVQNVPDPTGAVQCSEFTNPVNAQGPDDVWVVTPGTGNAMTFAISNATFDPHIYILGTCGDASSCVAGSDDEPSVTAPAITPTLTAGTTYYVYVDSFYPIGDADCCGSYTLNVTGTFPVSLKEFRID
ncbi:hypothetical protein [Dokdonella koreensis]|nr:hypothetical protein [Dokdonella koreensis]